MLLERSPELRFSVSHTTRAPRADEVDGRDYHFVDRAALRRARRRGRVPRVGRGARQPLRHVHRGDRARARHRRLLRDDLRHRLPGRAADPQRRSPTWWASSSCRRRCRSSSGACAAAPARRRRSVQPPLRRGRARDRALRPLRLRHRQRRRAPRLRRAPLDHGGRARPAAAAGAASRSPSSAPAVCRKDVDRMSDSVKGGTVLGVIGGSGLYEIEGLTDVEEVARRDALRRRRATPSSAAGSATRRCSSCPRHGRGHRIPPHEINFRANVCALKKLGATHLVSVSAVGSMKEEIAPGDFVVVDQFIDLHQAARVDVLRGRRRRARGLRRPGLPSDRRPPSPPRPSVRAPACTGAARTCASRARSSRRAPRACSTGRGACRSSA